MPEILSIFAADLPPIAFFGLMAGSLAGSLITVSLGLGGGILLLAIMANLLPPPALIPIHGAVQLASNGGRLAMLWRSVHWPALRAFAIGAAIGATLGGLIAIELPAWIVQASVGLFVIWTIIAKPPAWLSRWPLVTGAISSFLTMFFGATGAFVAGYVRALGLDRHGHVATHAALMTIQHGLKVAIFALIGFAYWSWLPLIVALSLAGLLGTWIGKHLLGQLTDHGFKRALDIVLVLISLRLIWTAARTALGS